LKPSFKNVDIFKMSQVALLKYSKSLNGNFKKAFRVDPRWQLGFGIRIPELCDSRNHLET
jgi:hypothetical protein